MDEFEQLKEKYLLQKALLEKEKQRLSEVRRKQKETEDDIEALQKVTDFIQRIANITLHSVVSFIQELVTTALEIIAPEYEFVMEFVTRRNTTECDLYLRHKELGHRIELTDVGGGVIDVVSFALRLAFWKLSKTQPVMILDEPFKFVSLDIPDEELLKTITQRLGIQIIAVTHKEKLIDALKGDPDCKIIRVKKVKNESKVEIQ